MSPTCTRPECSNPLNKGKEYCGRSCAAIDRPRRRAEKELLTAEARELIPRGIIETMVGSMGNDAYPVLDEMAVTLAEMKDTTPPLLSYLTDPGDLDPYRYGTLKAGRYTHRPDDLLSYAKIDSMRRNGQVLFGLAMKQAWLQSVFRNDRTWDIESKDEKVARVVKGMLSYLFDRHADEFMECVPYGSAFFEKIWVHEPGGFWGIDEHDGEKFYGYKSLESIHPRSIDKMRYTADGKHFNGFIQKPTTGFLLSDDVTVPVELALVLTYQKRFRNLWGLPALEPTYPFWFWYEVGLRSWLRYLERMGTPLCVVSAPSKGQIKTPDGASMRTMKYAFMAAGNAAKSNAMAIPSDTHPETNQRLWEITYLTDDKRGIQFYEAVKLLGTLIVRSMIIADRAMTQDSDTGSYAAGEIHLGVTMMHNEGVLASLIAQINSYLIAPILQYNFRARAKAVMVTEGLDPAEKARLFKLLGTVGNKADSIAMDKIDWEAIFKVEGIPTLSDEDFEALQKERMKRKEEMMAMQQKFAPQPAAPKSPGKNGGSRPPRGPADRSAQKAPFAQRIKASAEWVLYNIANGAQIPVVVTEERAMEIADRFAERPFMLFNPHHDPATGQFTTAEGGGFALSGVPASPKVTEYGSDAEAQAALGEFSEDGLAAWKDGRIHITPKGSKVFARSPQIREHALRHEAIHGRARAGKWDGPQNVRQAAFEEGSTDLLTAGSLGRASTVGYPGFTSSVATLARQNSGGNPSKAWQWVSNAHQQNSSPTYAPELPMGKWQDVEWMMASVPEKLEEVDGLGQWQSSEIAKWKHIYKLGEPDLREAGLHSE
jgi:hypothetical protein